MPPPPTAQESSAIADPSPSQPQVLLDDPNLYVNRELSLLRFQRRVLEEAQDPSNRLLERVKFLSILGSNLDEFFMVRVAGLLNQVDAGIQETSADAMTPRQQLDAIRADCIQLMDEARACLADVLFQLGQAGTHILDYSRLSSAQREIADTYFMDTIFPVLTPLAVDPGRPFPHISNLSLNFSILIRDKTGATHFARLKVPDTLDQLVPLQRAGKGDGRPLSFVWIEQVIQANLGALFPGMEILESHAFHVTRDADLVIQEIEAEDLLESVEAGVRQRRFGQVVRLIVTPEMPAPLLDILRHNLELDDSEIYRDSGPIGLVRLRALASIDRPELKDPPLNPAPLAIADDDDIFAAIRRGDILLHHPFDSFQPIVDFIRGAARDPTVLAIKMTLYRIGRNAPVVEALMEASERGKQVAALVELKARFDEESNIEWARALEKAGVHVVYGLVGLKIHAKVALVVRREGDVIRRYVHLSTGNYNSVTANVYTDLGLLTCDPEIGADATDLFNSLTGYSVKDNYRKLAVAPHGLHRRLAGLIEREMEHARNGRHAHLIFKVNALSDDRMTRLLYAASQAGVKIDLLVRGVSCLRPGIPGVSETIEVRSIVGRFLEHSRIYYFLNGGEEQVFLASADLMGRNLYRRVEVMFPIEQAALVREIRDRILATYLADNVKTRLMRWDGSYTRVAPEPGAAPVNSQLELFAARTSKTRK